MKKLLDYLPFHFLFFLVFGILLQYYFKVWNQNFPNIFLIASFISLLLFLIARKKGFEIALCIYFTFLGIVLVYNQDDRNATNYFENYPNQGTVKRLVVQKVLKPTVYFDRYEAKVIAINEEKTTGKLLVNIKNDSTDTRLQVGEYFHINQEFSELGPPLNPHQFNYKDYLAKKGVHRQVFIDSNQLIRENKYEMTIFRNVSLIRSKIQNSLKEAGFSNDEYAILNALLLGQRHEISKEIINDYANAGAIHILAVSGLHVGIVLMIVSFFLKPLERFKRGRIFKVIFIVSILWGFALVAGLSASVVRAVTMFSIVAVGQLFRRANSVLYSLILSMFLLLIVHPMLLFDVGFQLSYLAVFGIIWVQPFLYDFWKPKWKIIDFYWQLFTVSVAAQIGILPISVYYFHQFPGLFILSNLVIIPFLGVILFFGIGAIVLALAKVLPSYLVDVYGEIISLMNDFVHWVSNQESWLFTQISCSEFLLLSSYLVIVFGFQFLQKKSTKLLYSFFASVLMFQTVLWSEKWMSNLTSEFIVFHKSRHSIYGERRNNEVHMYHNLEIMEPGDENSISSYRIGEEVTIEIMDSVPKYFEMGNQSILLVGKEGIYTNTKMDSIVIILNDSPRINLERMIQELKPTYIVANGSNYKSFISLWKQTCMKTKTPFWYTGQKGAFIIR